MWRNYKQECRDHDPVLSDKEADGRSLFQKILQIMRHFGGIEEIQE